jgi:hypothetical protein
VAKKYFKFPVTKTAKPASCLLYGNDIQYYFAGNIKNETLLGGFIMAKSLYLKSVLMVMILCVIPFAAASAASEQPCNKEQSQQGGNAQPPQEKPSTDSVLVEAYLVEVSNAALAASGTAMLPGDGKKESVSITKLLWCMKDPNAGKVVSMARAFCRTGETAKSSTTKTVYVEHTAAPPVPATAHAVMSSTFQPYDSKSEIEVRPYINEAGPMFLELKFRHEGFNGQNTKKGLVLPPDKLAYNFDSTLTIKPGQPMIVGGMQNGDLTLFLIVWAEIVK